MGYKDEVRSAVLAVSHRRDVYVWVKPRTVVGLMGICQADTLLYSVIGCYSHSSADVPHPLSLFQGQRILHVFSKRELGDLKFISNTEPKPRLRQFKELGLGFEFQGFSGHCFYNHQREKPSTKHVQALRSFKGQSKKFHSNTTYMLKDTCKIP